MSKSVRGSFASELSLRPTGVPLPLRALDAPIYDPYGESRRVPVLNSQCPLLTTDTGTHPPHSQDRPGAGQTAQRG